MSEYYKFIGKSLYDFMMNIPLFSFHGIITYKNNHGDYEDEYKFFGGKNMLTAAGHKKCDSNLKKYIIVDAKYDDYYGGYIVVENENNDYDFLNWFCLMVIRATAAGHSSTYFNEKAFAKYIEELWTSQWEIQDAMKKETIRGKRITHHKKSQPKMKFVCPEKMF